MRVGWAVPSVDADKPIGVNDKSFTFDGSTAHKWHNGSEAYGKRWKTNDVIGCLLDFDEQCISFSVNGELMIDNQGQELAFSDIGSQGLVPVAYFAEGQRAELNLGVDPNSFKFYKMYGLQEGYAPFCQNISYPLPIWYTKSLPSFTPIIPTDSTRVVRIQAGIASPPILRIQYKAFAGARVLEVPNYVYTRLSIPVKIDEVLKKAPQNRVNIFDNVEEVDMFDRDLDILKQEGKGRVEHFTIFEKFDFFRQFQEYRKF